MTTRFVILLALVTAACREASGDGTSRETARVTHNVVAPPCSGCTVDLPPERTDPQPVLFVLHGNRGSGKAVAARWRAAALSRGVAVVGLHCPRDRGCERGKWYAWSETPAFVLEALATIARDVPLDPARTYLAGWSGGASAIGQHLDQWAPFSAIVIHGGGQPPIANGDGERACPPHAMPMYFLVGDANPAHGAAVSLREHVEKCASPIEWDLLPRADHAAEKRALDRRKGGQILDWLARHSEGR